jgi:hypothetical protein
MTKELNIHDMKQSDFHALPCRKWDEDIGGFDSIIILPTRRRYDRGSNWGVMDFVACIGSKPIMLLSGCSDVLHIEGIGGLGEWVEGVGWPDQLKTKAWSIDLLFKSKLTRLRSKGLMTCGCALSSFEIYSAGAKS